MADHVVKACLITNPRSGRGEIDLSDALTVLRGQGWDVIVRQKLHGGHATELARAAVDDGFDVVVDCGGDGTLSEIVDGVIGSDIAVGVLPGGTANLWAQEMGIARRLRVAALQLVGAVRRRVDVGHISVNGKKGQHFLLMAGLGLDGAVIARVSKPLKNRIGPLAVGLATLEALPSFRAVPVRVEMDGVHWQGRVSQIVVGNTRRYAGFTRMTADALIDDGLLDICLITATGPAAATKQFASLLVRQRPSVASSETYRAATMTVYSPVVLPLQIDGGAVKLKREGPTANGMVYTCTLLTQAVSVLIPRTHGGELFQHASSRGAVVRPPLASADGIPVTLEGLREDKPHPRPGKQTKKSRRLMTIMFVGVDSMTVARDDDGRVFTVLLTPETLLQDESGATRPILDVLSVLTDGDSILVSGKKDKSNGCIVAKKLKLYSARMASGGDD